MAHVILLFLHVASPPVDCTQEKSMFCRISGDSSSGGDMRYYPFRLTPYLLTLRDSDMADPQPCCLLIAERVHSGYEGKHMHTHISSYSVVNFLWIPIFACRSYFLTA